MAMGSGGTSDVNADINVTPMVDIMLVLLIIFMVVTPLLQSGVNLTLPKGKAPEEDPDITKDTAVVISIPSNGVYYVGRDPVRKELLVDKIKTRMKAAEKPGVEPIVYIKGDVTVQYGEVVDIVNLIRDSGYGKIGLVSDKKKASEQ